MRQRVWQVLEVSRNDDGPSRVVDVFLLGLILVNVIACVLESVDRIYAAHGPALVLFEVFSLAVFSVEYVLRVWSCTADERYRHPVWGRLRYMRTPLALIDLIVILPVFALAFHAWVRGFDLRVLRGLRMLRLAQLAKTGRYSASLRLMGRAVAARREELALTLAITVILLVVCSTLMFYVEHDAQPDQFADIPSAMWWGVATLTTVGYGDISPITPLGKLLGAVVAMLGIGLFALPAGLLGSSFMEELECRRKPEVTTCPHCGETI